MPARQQACLLGGSLQICWTCQEQDMQHAVVNAVLEELILDAEADDALRLEQEREAIAEVPVRMPLPVIVPDGSLKKKKKKGFCSIF